MKEIKNNDLKGIDYQVKTDELIKEIIFLRQFGVSKYQKETDTSRIKETNEHEK